MSSNNFARLCEVEKVHQHHFYLLGAFCMIVRNFRVVMRNQFSLLPFELQPKSSSGPFRTFVRILRMFMRNWKTWFFNFFLPFLPFLFLDSTSTTSKSTPNQLQIPVQTNCITSFIVHLDHHRFDSSLLSLIYQNHTLKWLQNFIKHVSNSYKGKNMLIECFRHNYYSKDVKLIRIII